MAEVRINITAEDNTASVLDAVSEAVKGVAASVEQLSGGAGSAIESMQFLSDIMSGFEGLTIAVNTGELGELEKRLTELDSSLKKALVLDVAGAKAAVDEAGSAIGALETLKALELDVSDAVRSADEVQAAIDAMPDVSYKTVIVQYKTQASPVMDFSEGMAYIKERMSSLPTDGTYKIRYENVDGRETAQALQHTGGSQQSISFSPTIQILSTGGQSGRELADELDRALAEKWRYNRSELRRAMAG